MNENKSFVELAEEYALLDEEKRNLEEQLDDVKDEMKQIEEELLNVFEHKGISNINIAGKTIYLHRQLWAGYVNNIDEAVVALKNAGLGDYVKERFNTHSLSAYFRELYREREEEVEGIIEPEDILTPDLKEQIKLTEKVHIRARKS
jgi:predicted  nucleic acid-binding Zn-ribbon protein